GTASLPRGRVSGPDLVPMAFGLGQCRAWPGGAGHPEEPAAAGRLGARSRRPVGVPQRLSASAVGRHGAARGAGARARQRSDNPHPRRAARQARLADPHHHAGRDCFALATLGFYHAARHPRCGRGVVSCQPCHRAQRPARTCQSRYPGGPALSAPPRRSLSRGPSQTDSRLAWIGRHMVTASGNMAAREPQVQAEPDNVARASLLAKAFAERAPLHDRDGSFPFRNFEDLSQAGLLALTVPAALGGGGAGAAETARILGIIGKADPSTALVLSMHYIQHLVMARSARWPVRLSRKLARETVEGVALVNALRVEPELGSPARGGLPATIA